MDLRPLPQALGYLLPFAFRVNVRTCLSPDPKLKIPVPAIVGNMVAAQVFEPAGDFGQPSIGRKTDGHSTRARASQAHSREESGHGLFSLG
jgi:hypothetical protein